MDRQTAVCHGSEENSAHQTIMDRHYDDDFDENPNPGDTEREGVLLL